MEVILSVFPGIDLLGKAFEQEGACVLRGPDPAIGTGDIRRFHPPLNLSGIIGGSPCQDFSKLRRDPPTGYSLEMIGEFVRMIIEGKPLWWLLENVPSVPDVKIAGYTHQRIDLKACEFGSKQRRLRHFQFGHSDGKILTVDRPVTPVTPDQPCCVASEGAKKIRRDWSTFCVLQGLPPDFELPYFTQTARYRAVGNGVPLQMGRAIAIAILRGLTSAGELKVCECSCGRRVHGRQKCASEACRQRLSRKTRNRDLAAVHTSRVVTDKA